MLNGRGWAKSHRFAVLISLVNFERSLVSFAVTLTIEQPVPRGKFLLPGIVVESFFERRRRRMIYLRAERSPARSYVILS